MAGNSFRDFLNIDLRDIIDAVADKMRLLPADAVMFRQIKMYIMKGVF